MVSSVQPSPRIAALATPPGYQAVLTNSRRTKYATVDDATGGGPAYYMVNCAHPSHFENVVSEGGAWAGRIAGLRDAGARITVVAPEVAQSVEDLAARGLLRWDARAYDTADVSGHDLVVPATGDPALDARVAGDARAVGRWCTVPDPAPDAVPDATAATQPRAPGGSVTLVGGGPGDPGLITVAGLDAVRAADVVVTDRLAPLGVLHGLDVEVIDVGKIPRGRSTPQEEINRILVEHARAGRRVVRLKGGDSFVFGRGGEELEACTAAGIPVVVVPGVTSAIAGPALAGIPVTHRGLTQGFTVVSGHLPPGDPRSTVDWGALARTGTDIVLLMAVATLPAITQTFVAEGLKRFEFGLRRKVEADKNAMALTG